MTKDNVYRWLKRKFCEWNASNAKGMVLLYWYGATNDPIVFMACVREIRNREKRLRLTTSHPLYSHIINGGQNAA